MLHSRLVCGAALRVRAPLFFAPERAEEEAADAAEEAEVEAEQAERREKKQ